MDDVVNNMCYALPPMPETPGLDQVPNEASSAAAASAATVAARAAAAAALLSRSLDETPSTAVPVPSCRTIAAAAHPSKAVCAIEDELQ